MSTPFKRPESNLFIQYVITENPSDHPGLFVVREAIIGPGTVKPGEGFTAKTLEEARKLVPPWADFRFVRETIDDPVIVETWI